MGADLTAVDYNEDFSAFHAGTLQDQVDYLVRSVGIVIAQYDHLSPDERPGRVVLLGHSMGGVVARLAVARLDNLVHMIITMSTPHAYPPVILEASMDALYESMNSQSTGPMRPIVSICGGVSDIDIASDACALASSPALHEGSITVFTTAMPGVWTGVEHQAMVWCHQVRWRIARALFDLVLAPDDAVSKTARKWFVNEDVANGHQNHHIIVPVSSGSMAIIIRLPSHAPRPLFDVEHCNEMDCQPVVFSTLSIPQPNLADSPFPLPGEGIGSREVAYVLDLQLGSLSGYLKLYVEAGAEVLAGDYIVQQARNSRWGTFPWTNRLIP